LVLAILDSCQALYKVSGQLEERGILTLLQPGLTQASLHDCSLRHILEALCATNLNKVFSVIALKAPYQRLSFAPPQAAGQPERFSLQQQTCGKQKL
jgi:hypothetical protein